MTKKQAIFSLMGGRVWHNPGAYNPTSDAVWLAAFGNPDAKTVLDVGTGTGAVALCYAVHNPTAKITAIDISPDMLAAARQNAELNRREIEFICDDISKWKTDRTFDLVLTNPPYFKGTPAAHNAHHNVDIAAWTRVCVRRVRPRGHFCIITDASTTDTVIAAMKPTCGDITIFPLFGAKNTAERVLISGRVGARGGARLHRGLSMNTDAVLRDGLTIQDSLTKLGQK